MGEKLLNPTNTFSHAFWKLCGKQVLSKESCREEKKRELASRLVLLYNYQKDKFHTNW